jgi:signal transduction histidine kinase
MLRLFQRYLGVKIFISYLIVILVSGIVMVTAAELSIPGAFNRHLSAMREAMAGMGGDEMLEVDLYDSYLAAVTETLLLGGMAAVAAALLVSLFVSREVVAPVRALNEASERIAEGHYVERVDVRMDLPRSRQDELARLALSFNRMAEMLEKTESMRRQLIGDVTHELRTPLTAIQGYMEGLMDGVLPADESTYQTVSAEAGRLKRLVDDLQELSRIEAGAFELSRLPVDVASLLQAACRRLERQYAEKGVSLLVADLPAQLPLVWADEDRLNQVLTNLLGNALQYTPPGGQVRVSASHQEKELLVQVSDSGAGIAAEHLPLLFTRFYRVDKSRSRAGGGSGIGLTIARHLVEAHGGRIWAESPGPGEGSTFSFSLPVNSS